MIAAELLICSVHPVPGSYHFLWASPRHRRFQIINSGDDDDVGGGGSNDDGGRLIVRFGGGGGGGGHVLPIDDDDDEMATTKVPFDVLLSLPMFLRLYLVGRGKGTNQWFSVRIFTKRKQKKCVRRFLRARFVSGDDVE